MDDRHCFVDVFNGFCFVNLHFQFSPQLFKQIKSVKQKVNLVNVQECQFLMSFSNFVCLFLVSRQLSPCLNEISETEQPKFVEIQTYVCRCVKHVSFEDVTSSHHRKQILEISFTVNIISMIFFLMGEIMCIIQVNIIS